MTRLAPYPLVFIGAMALSLPALAAYETVDASGGGAISGTVTLTGSPSKLKKATFPKNLNKADRNFCNSKRPLTSVFYAVKGGKLANVAVWLHKVKKGKRRAKAQGKLANKDCRFFPLVQTMEVGAKLLVTNDDPINHTTHPVYTKLKITAFNIAMPKKGQRAKKKIRRAGLMRVQCDAGHVWMRAWIHAFKHPYHTVTGSDGAFSLDQIPPGEYTLKAWHEKGGTITRKVKVAAGGKVQVDLTFKVK